MPRWGTVCTASKERDFPGGFLPIGPRIEKLLEGGPDDFEEMLWDLGQGIE